MGQPEKGRELRSVIGRSVERLRRERDLRQEDLSIRLRHWGLPWSRSRIAEVESGSRPVSLEALLLLARAFSERSPVVLADFFDGDDTAVLSPRARASLSEIRGSLRGAPVHVTLEAGAGDAHQAALKSGVGKLQDRLTNMPAVVRHADFERLGAAEATTVTEADARAAKALNIDTLALSLAASELWGRSYAAERDKRADERHKLLNGHTGPDEGARARSAIRGRVSRELMAELRDFISVGESSEHS